MPGTASPAESAAPVPAPGGELDAEPAWLAGTGGEFRWLVVAAGFFLASLARPLAGERIQVFYETGILFLMGVGWLGPAFIRARRQALRVILDRFAQEEQVFRVMYQEFVGRHERGWRPVSAGLLAAVVFLGFRLAVSWELVPYVFEVTRMAVTLAGALAFGLFARTLWMLLGFGMLVSRMSLEFERLQDRLFSWELLERAGTGYARTAFGASFASLALFWIAVASRGLIGTSGDSPVGVVSALLLLMVLALVVPLAYLLIPIWRLHRILVRRKEEIRGLFAGEFLRTEREFLEKPRRELAQKYLTERQAVEEVEKLPEWPFRAETLAKILTLVAIPAGLFLVKEILVEVLVALLKKG